MVKNEPEDKYCPERRSPRPTPETEGEGGDPKEIVRGPSSGNELKTQGLEVDVGQRQHEEYLQKIESLHDELSNVFRDMCERDQWLKGVPSHPCLQELQYLLETAEGGGMSVTVRKRDGHDLDFRMSKTATVGDLQALIEHRTEVEQAPSLHSRHIHWRYVWAKHHLVCNGVRLRDASVALKDYGLKDDAVVTFGRTIAMRERKWRQRTRPGH